ncbi:hypothetical protein C2E25_10200 [Geothermobacter hydrogeniphilus]|uniref:Right handed beta helix domain-containing protein n=1 Tax=Geothermobacter hydrogeniphilus TaxID=1969733 RepID=A0A2K2H9K9_9BACT|nr:right-handed parallel beta-helix repeat-containing protein [Geothermobacter hydrogeniphilus]PNU19909.1 hypothetical protein C2E25_10200 [Geothermobacter hydrogeniphilus]
MTRLLCLVLLLASCLPAAAETRYSGEQTLWQDTVWSGDVLIDGILTVAPGVRLEIRPGTAVRFTFFDSNGDGLGEHEIFIQGRLLALGTAEQPILFTSAEAVPRPGAWGAINMMASEDDNLLRHCVVEYAYRGFHAHFGKGRIEDSLFRRNLRAFQFQDSTVKVSRCQVLDNFNGLQFRDATVVLEQCRITGGQWAIRGIYSDLTLTGCLIENNRINAVSLRESTLVAEANRIAGNRRGIFLQRGKGTLRGNRIVGNAEHGTFFEDSEVILRDNRITANGRAGIRWLDSQGVIAGNDLSGNGEYALMNDGSGDLQVGSNWWGSVDEKRIDQLIRDRRDRPETGLVRYAAPLSGKPSAGTTAKRLLPE